jgi:hypothetical protein
MSIRSYVKTPGFIGDLLVSSFWVLETLPEKSTSQKSIGDIVSNPYIVEKRHFRKRPNKRGGPVGPFPIVSLDVFIGYVKMRNPKKKLTANRKQGESLGLHIAGATIP